MNMTTRRALIALFRAHIDRVVNDEHRKNHVASFEDIEAIIECAKVAADESLELVRRKP